MCAPGSTSLKVVNTTEARICGIPKTVKSNTSTAAAIPATSPTAVSSPPTTTKVPAANVAAPKQQKITTTPAKQTIGANKETTTTAVSDKPSSPSTIAPQVKAISKKHQQQVQLQPATGNVPAGRKYTFATTSTAVTPDTLKYLGYKGSATAVNSGNSSTASKDKHGSDTKSSSSGQNDDSGKSASSSSSIINDISSVIKKSFNYKHSRHSGGSDVVSYSSDNSFDDNFPFTASSSLRNSRCG
jgi:hypothetical protein